MDKQSYQTYLRSRHWQRTRKTIIALIKTCVLCDSPQRLEVHHRHYRTLGSENVEDVTVLCHTCHTRYHQQQQAAKKRADKWTKPRSKQLTHKRRRTTTAWIVAFCILL